MTLTSGKKGGSHGTAARLVPVETHIGNIIFDLCAPKVSLEFSLKRNRVIGLHIAKSCYIARVWDGLWP